MGGGGACIKGTGTEGFDGAGADGAGTCVCVCVCVCVCGCADGEGTGGDTLFVLALPSASDAGILALSSSGWACVGMLATSLERSLARALRV